jgi:hypothetical protein
VHAVVLDVQLLVAERREGGRVETPARLEILDDEEDVIDDDAPNRHLSPPSG